MTLNLNDTSFQTCANHKLNDCLCQFEARRLGIILLLCKINERSKHACALETKYLSAYS